MNSERSLKNLSLEILLELQADASRELSTSISEIKTAEDVQRYRIKLDIIRKDIVSKRAELPPLK